METTNFSGQVLCGKDFKNRDLSGSSFKNSDIRGANFSGANLSKCDFSGALAGLRNSTFTFLVLIGFSILIFLQLVVLTLFSTLFSVLEVERHKNGYFLAILVAVIFASTFSLIIQKGYSRAKDAWGENKRDELVFKITLSLICLGNAIAILSLLSIFLDFHQEAELLILFASYFTFSGISLAFGLAGFSAMHFVSLISIISSPAAATGTLTSYLISSYSQELNWLWPLFFLVFSVLSALYIRYGLVFMQNDDEFSYIKLILVNFSSLGGTSFRKADLRDANFYKANLAHCDFREAKLHRVNFMKSFNINLSRQENPRYSTLSNPKARKLLVSKNGECKSYQGISFKSVNLSNANLYNADLCEVDLTDSDLRGADLRGANLTRVQAVNVDFRNARLTGACLAAWNIDSTTLLHNVESDYVFLGNNYTERRPSSKHDNFAPGEFTALFQKALSTVDLIFKDGINWEAFLYSFKQLKQNQNYQDVSVQSIERKGDSFVVRLEVDTEANKAEIETRVKQIYRNKLKKLEAKYEERLKLQGLWLEDVRRHIETERHDKANLMRIMAIMAKDQSSKYDMRGSHFGQFVDTAQEGSQVQSIQHNYALEQKQSLVEAADEIAKLLSKLSINYSPAEVPGKAVEEIQKSPMIKQRVIGAIQSGGKAALEELVDHPAISIILASIEGAMERR